MVFINKRKLGCFVFEMILLMKHYLSKLAAAQEIVDGQRAHNNSFPNAAESPTVPT